MQLRRLVVSTVTIALTFPCFAKNQTQTSTEIYNAIKDAPSKIRWCLPEAGDDPAHIISDRCEVYKKCLDKASMDEKVDQQLDLDLSSIQITNVKACHQTLYNAARVNPQIKGSKATQDWLEHHVHPGTAAKSFPVPQEYPRPR